MCKLTELTLSTDHKAVLIDGNCSWIELRGAIENIAFITPRCEACPKATFLSCIQLDAVNRQANCEMFEEVKLFTQMGDAPMPQVGQLYREQYQKPQVVIEEPKPAPEPTKKTSLVNKLLGRV